MGTLSKGLWVPDGSGVPSRAQLIAMQQSVNDRSGLSFALAAGQGNITLTAATDSGALAVVFPGGRFTLPPLILVTVVDSANNGLWGTADTVTASGCNIRMHSRASITVTRPVTWWAVQMLPGSAAG